MNIIMETFKEGWASDLTEIFIPIAWLNRNSGAELLGKIANKLSEMIDLSELKILESSDVEDERRDKYFILSIMKEDKINWDKIIPLLKEVIQEFFPHQENISLQVDEKHDWEDTHDGYIFVDLRDYEEGEETCILCGSSDCPGYTAGEDKMVDPPCIHRHH